MLFGAHHLKHYQYKVDHVCMLSASARGTWGLWMRSVDACCLAQTNHKHCSCYGWPQCIMHIDVVYQLSASGLTWHDAHDTCEGLQCGMLMPVVLVTASVMMWCPTPVWHFCSGVPHDAPTCSGLGNSLVCSLPSGHHCHWVWHAPYLEYTP